MAGTFMKEVYKGVQLAVEKEPGRSQIAGLNKESLVESVRVITEALDSLPDTTNIHILFFALTYVRNAVGLAMEENNQRLATETGGSA